jgi:cytidylate kinase
MKTDLIIAIDGPSGAGKSSSSRRLAERLGYRYIDTGALYRVIGLLAWERQTSPDDAEGLAALCRNLPLRFVSEPTDVRLFLGARDITAAIRQPEVSQMASKVSAQPAVRQALLTLQRQMGQDGGVVLEGRDIGTVVFPDADLKFFLDAAPEERGWRRHRELQQQGMTTTLDTTLREMAERDRRDSGREHAPLRRAEDAIVVDTTTLSLQDVVQRLLQHVAAIRKC